MKKKATLDDLMDIETRLAEIEGTVIGVLVQQVNVLKDENERLHTVNKKQGSALILLQQTIQGLEDVDQGHEEVIRAIFDHPKISATAKKIMTKIIEGPGEDQTE
jgi:regulator of replication initiation timing